MSKRIIFCADGTWDLAESATNVFGIYHGIDVSSTQVVFYDVGVGTSGTFFERFKGGAFGEGLFEKIKDGYTKIAHVYEQDDEIFIFGFSRGAYTARSLAGMIAICGLPTGNFDDIFISRAFEAYRDATKREKFKADFNLYDVKIKMIGVWDTVGSLGIPAIMGGVEDAYAFLDTTLHPNVENAYQALAIDEKRREFPPTLWIPPNPPIQGQALEQIWFAGVHCDVGGGNPEVGLANVTLSWMVNKAKDLGVQFKQEFLEEYLSIDSLYALDIIADSWSAKWGFPLKRTVPDDAHISNSVIVRMENDIAYRPTNLKYKNEDLSDSYKIIALVKPQEG